MLSFREFMNITLLLCETITKCFFSEPFSPAGISAKMLLVEEQLFFVWSKFSRQVAAKVSLCRTVTLKSAAASPKVCFA